MLLGDRVPMAHRINRVGHGRQSSSYLVVGCECIPLLNSNNKSVPISTTFKMYVRGITANGTNIDHPVTEFHEGATETALSPKMTEGKDNIGKLPFNRDIHVCNVMQDEVDENFVFLLADKLDE